MLENEDKSVDIEVEDNLEVEESASTRLLDTVTIEEDIDDIDNDEEDNDEVENSSTVDEVKETENKRVMVRGKEKFEKLIGTEAMHQIPHGLSFLVGGYKEYAKEIVVDRAITNIDGMKPSQRRILYIMKDIEKVKSLRKCGDIAGSTMKIHPHGDASIYDTMVRMTHSSLYLNVPYIRGKGSFGKVFSRNGKAAAARYTECEFEKISEELFKGMQGVEMIPSYNNEFVEPVLLPVSFPTILCNPSQGIAIGIASNIPSFNFHEVNNATIEYLKTGEITTLLAPDFTTGGCYIENKSELRKLMLTGNAKLKLRGKWHIEGKVIVIDEIPYYTTVEDIMAKVKDLPGVNDTKDECDKRGLRLTIECATKKVVDSVLQEVLRVSPLQMTFNSNIVVIVDNVPRVIGVYDVIKEWVKFREDVKEKQIKGELEAMDMQIARYDILVDLMTTYKREPFLTTLLNDGRAKAKELLGGYYPTTDSEIFDWILDKSIGSLGGIGNKQISYLEELRVERVKKEETLGNIKELIIEELEEVNRKYKFPRRTEITTHDYVFDRKAAKKVVEPVPVSFQLQGKFIKKMKATPTNLAIEGVIKCQSTDIISMLDNKGRLLRVYMDQLPMNTANDKGTYLPVYLGEGEEDFEIVELVIVSDRKIGYMYKDGYAAVVNYGEWIDAKRKTKVTPIGIAPDYIDKLVGTFSMADEVVVMYTKKGKMAVVPTDFMEKSRRARTKLVSVGKGDEVVKVGSMSRVELSKVVLNADKFENHFRVVAKADKFNTGLFDSICSTKK